MHNHTNESSEKTHNDPSSDPERLGSKESERSVQRRFRDSRDNWGTELIKSFVHPFAMTATPIFLFLLTAYFVLQRFHEDRWVGIRSLCGALIPLIFITFIHKFKNSFLVRAGSQTPLWSFILSSLWGFGLMLILQLFNLYLHIKYVPLNELILSGSFSLLVFTYVQDKKNNAEVYYYGMLIGLMVYIFFFSFPLDIVRR